jgi:hypothetical protein
MPNTCGEPKNPSRAPMAMTIQEGPRSSQRLLKTRVGRKAAPMSTGRGSTSERDVAGTNSIDQRLRRHTRIAVLAGSFYPASFDVHCELPLAIVPLRFVSVIVANNA